MAKSFCSEQDDVKLQVGSSRLQAFKQTILAILFSAERDRVTTLKITQSVWVVRPWVGEGSLAILNILNCPCNLISN
jgi:hypothetical protein